MKRTIITLMAIVALVAASCTKEDNIRPIFNDMDTTTPVDPNIPNVDLTQLVGNWLPNSGSAWRVLLYDKTTGELVDSIISDLGEKGFNIHADGTADTPWDITATYTATEQQITFNLLGVVDYTFDLVKLNAERLVMERTTTSDYYYSNPDTGDTDTLQGVENMHYDLTRSK